MGDSSAFDVVVNGSLKTLPSMTTLDEFPLLMPAWGYAASAFALFLIGFFGFFLNLFVIILMFKDRQLWTPLNMILFNLVCSDFCVSILGNPLTLVSALFHHWIFGETMCVMYGFFMALLGITSITTLTVLSFERYMMVTRPLSARHLSCKSALLVIFFIWIYSLALTTPPLFGWGQYVNEAANISCSVNWHNRSNNTLTYILFLFAFGQIIPFAVITFSYTNILRTIRKNSKKMGRVGRAESKVTAMVLMMIIAFTIAWTPYSVFALMEQFAKEGIISPGVGVVPALVAKSSICYDPIIYIGMNSQYRQAIKRLFSDHSKSGLSQTDRACGNTAVSPAHPRSKCSTAASLASSHTAAPAVRVTIVPDLHGTRDLVSIPEVTVEDGKEHDTSESRSSEPCGECSRSMSNHSPILTIVETDKLLYKTHPDKAEDAELRETVYSNEAFEDAEVVVPRRMRPSQSLELSRPQYRRLPPTPTTPPRSREHFRLFATLTRLNKDYADDGYIV